MSQKPETRFKIRALERLRAIRGSEWEKIQQVSIRGTPDIFGCYHGRMVAIELKTNQGKPDPLQVYRLKRWERAGGLALLMSPATMDKDLETIRQIPENKNN